MRNLMFLAVFVLLLSCSNDDDCGCTQVKAGTESPGISNLHFIQLCDETGLQIDRSTSLPVIENKSAEQLQARSVKEGCDRD
ncbi:hypothetical protein [Maribacter flavus]|uniref:Uncharacterized protein n=1 Tax=Maribacter flavus TaxID=1658664 RepID=A0A5B2TVK0_9FLAO|nr:hypothetical protein [Maribacter flavus]KAA2218541.1 hypothetical protein F0361_02655 [Maribacter flavus]